MQVIPLGTGSATPMLDRHPSCVAVKINSEVILFDCGECAQWQMLKYQIKPFKIHHIFISHLHGDHYLGLIGLMCTLNSLQRTQPLHVYAPPGLKEIISLQLYYQNTFLQYPLHIHELSCHALTRLFANEHYQVYAFPMQHRVITHGFLLKTQPGERKIFMDKLPGNVSLHHIHTLKKAQNVLNEKGQVKYAFEDYTTAPPPVKRFAYCSDTCFDENLIPFIEDVDLLYHEATFLHEKLARATETFHTTAKQAAQLARKANVKKLLIGHFSARYKDITPLLKEAQAEFAHTEYAQEGVVYQI